jgi:hypothetical protein
VSREAVLYTQGFNMSAKIIITLAALVGSAFAAEVPRKSPEFTVQLAGGKQASVSDYRGKVLCLVFILTT